VWSQVGERGEQNGVVGHTQPLALAFFALIRDRASALRRN